MTFYTSQPAVSGENPVAPSDPFDVGLRVEVRNIKPAGSMFVDIDQFRLQNELQDELQNSSFFRTVRVDGSPPEITITVRATNYVTELPAQYLSAMLLGLLPVPSSNLDIDTDIQVWIDGRPTEISMTYQDRMVLWMGVPVVLVGPFAGGAQHHERFAEALAERIISELDNAGFSNQYISQFRNVGSDPGREKTPPSARTPNDGPNVGRGSPPTGTEPVPGELSLYATGTGFAVAPDGIILTNYHVVANNDEIRLRLSDGTEVIATVVAYDSDLDLAVLESDATFRGLPIALRSARLGEAVFAIGYPNPEIQGFSPKYTDGSIGALSGIQDDPRIYQISVPVQPGNSGGPLVSTDGTVLGVVVARLNDAAIFDMTGSLPQNVNYAIKSTRVAAFLSENGIDFATSRNSPENDIDAISLTEENTVTIMTYSR